MQGGISMVSKRYAKANNPLVPDYDPSKPKKYIMYLDANNLYGWAMSKALPKRDFKWKRVMPNEEEIMKKENAKNGCILEAVFEPAQLPQETICPSVAFAKGQIGNSRGQSIIYYSINTVFVLSYKLSFCCPRKNKTLLKQCCGCGKCKFSFIFTVCKFTLINQTETCCVIVQLNIHLSAL